MSIELCVLASGSAGNCTVLRTPAGIVLIDAGIGPRTAAGRLKGTGVRRFGRGGGLPHPPRPRPLQPELGPHAGAGRGAGLLPRQPSKAAAAGRVAEVAGFEAVVRGFDGEPFEPVPGLRFRAVPLAHDADGSHGFVIDGFGAAHRLRHRPRARAGGFPSHFCDLDVLALESNYDPVLQRDSGRPWFLQRRITGGRGHLSNEQAFAAVRTILDRCEAAGRRLPAPRRAAAPQPAVQLPGLGEATVQPGRALAKRLVLAEQHERTPWLGVEKPFVGRQLTLAWG